MDIFRSLSATLLALKENWHQSGTRGTNTGTGIYRSLSADLPVGMVYGFGSRDLCFVFTTIRMTWHQRPGARRKITILTFLNKHPKQQCCQEIPSLVYLFIIKVCRQSRKTFLLLCCLFFLVYFFSFISFPLSAFCDFSVIFQRISLIFGQLVDNNL